MTMTINGAGSITGLSVGGLPDGTVAQPDLATNVAGNGPAFSAYQSVAQSLPQNTVTKLQFQTKEFDTNNNFDNVTNYRFTPTIAGYYQVSCGFQVATTQASLSLAVYKNGSVNKSIINSSAVCSSASGSVLVLMNGTTDYIEVFGSQSATAQNTAASAFQTYFQAFLVRAA